MPSSENVEKETTVIDLSVSDDEACTDAEEKSDKARGNIEVSVGSKRKVIDCYDDKDDHCISSNSRKASKVLEVNSEENDDDEDDDVDDNVDDGDDEDDGDDDDDDDGDGDGDDDDDDDDEYVIQMDHCLYLCLVQLKVNPICIRDMGDSLQSMRTYCDLHCTAVYKDGKLHQGLRCNCDPNHWYHLPFNHELVEYIHPSYLEKVKVRREDAKWSAKCVEPRLCMVELDELNLHERMYRRCYETFRDKC